MGITIENSCKQPIKAFFKKQNTKESLSEKYIPLSGAGEINTIKIRADFQKDGRPSYYRSMLLINPFLMFQFVSIFNIIM